MTPDVLRTADLFAGLASEHMRAAVVTAPDVFPRTFTLKELVRRGDVVGQRPDEERPERSFAKAHQGRTTRELMGESAADPIGQPRLGDLTERMVWLLWGDDRYARRSEAISWRE